MAEPARDEQWWRVRPPTTVNGDLHQVLATVDSLQRAWADAVRHESPEEFRESRLRNLRRHAIETGIIERLYKVDWGVTEALVAEGLSAEVAQREGGITENALETIRSQFDALTFLAEAARTGRPLSAHFIRELHAALCRSQTTYEAVDQFGRPVNRPLRHGSWKELPNRAHHRDGSVLVFAPPDQVESEMDRLVELSTETDAVHPLVAAAWLHHRFVVIHPFDDGNGRVARALTLLVLLRRQFAPLVVDRFSREEYLSALEAANDGDLRDLVRLFARLEMVALRAELERPIAALSPPAAGAVDVAKAYVAKLQDLQSEKMRELATASAAAATTVNAHVSDRLQEVGAQLLNEFRRLDPAAGCHVYCVEPPDERARWWRAQIVRTARRAGFYANLADGTWWSQLRLSVLGQDLRFIVVTQKVGHGETGVLATTVLGEAVATGASTDQGPTAYTTLITPDASDSLTLVTTDGLDPRLDELDELVERTLAAAVARFAQTLA